MVSYHVYPAERDPQVDTPAGTRRQARCEHIAWLCKCRKPNIGLRRSAISTHGPRRGFAERWALLAYLTFIRQNRSALGFGVLNAFFAAPGQTAFVAIFVSAISTDLAVGPDTLGFLYMIATIGAALFLVTVGHHIDRMSLRSYAAAAALFLAAACAAMATASGVVTLCIGLLGMRCGGIILSHIEGTATARAFDSDRGKALAVTALGMPFAEAVLPILLVLLLGSVGWRWSHAIMGVAAILVLLPVGQMLLRHVAERPGRYAVEIAPRFRDGFGNLAKSGFFWAVLPCLLVVPFVSTAFMFHLYAMSAARGWSVELVALSFIVLAVANAFGLVASGPLIDRLSARTLLPLHTLPHLAALALFALATRPWVLPIVLGLVGFGSGITKTLVGAVWAEIYGTLHLGAIRSLVGMLKIVAGAAGPPVLGVLLGAGYDAGAAVMMLVIGGTVATATVGFAYWKRCEVG